MEVYIAMFHSGDTDSVVSVFSTEQTAKAWVEHCAARIFPASKFSWNGHFFTCGNRYEEWSVQEWDVQE